jgi:small-conductance mechanosensitive channel
VPSTPRRRRWWPRRLRVSAPSSLPIGRDALLALEARIRPDFKRAVAAGLVALVCIAVADALGGVRREDHLRVAAAVLTVAFAIFGIVAVRSAAREVYRLCLHRAGATAASAVRLVTSIVGYLFVLLGILQLVNIDLSNLLLGGAVTGVVVGIAAQQTLGNFFAGLVLIFARPYLPGQRIVVNSGALGGPFEGIVTSAGLIFTTLQTDTGPINLPNAGLLSAAIGPAPPPTETGTATATATDTATDTAAGADPIPEPVAETETAPGPVADEPRGRPDA